MVACLPCLKRFLVHLQGVAMALVAPEMLKEGHGKPAATTVPSSSCIICPREWSIFLSFQF